MTTSKRLTSLAILFALLTPAASRADLRGAPVRRPTGPVAEAQTSRWMKLVAEKAVDGGWRWYAGRTRAIPAKK